MANHKTPLDALRHHVSGAIDRGKATAIGGIEHPFKLRESKTGVFTITGPGGMPARTTEGSVFATMDEPFAREALAYLNQPRNGMAKRQGAAHLKSMFGTE